MKRDPLYSVWSSMIQRCHNQKNRQFKDYGGRGITVCDRWRSSYRTFREDMGPRPPGMTVERMKNHLGYSPENCCWATRQAQNSNKRNCIYLVDVGSERITLREYCRRRDLKYRPIVKRVQDRGWPLELAIMLPVSTGKPDTAMLLELWGRLEEMRDSLRLMIKAVDGHTVSDQLINTARRLCDEAEDVRLAA